MKGWSFVFLAYGIVWCALLVYWTTLKKRLRKAAEELARLRARGASIGLEHQHVGDRHRARSERVGHFQFERRQSRAGHRLRGVPAQALRSAEEVLPERICEDLPGQFPHCRARCVTVSR